MRHPERNSPKYGITLYGVDEKLYPFMDNIHAKPKIDRLLASDELFNIHSRRDPVNMSTLVRQLPFLGEDALSLLVADMGEGVKPRYSKLEERNGVEFS